MRWRRHNSSQIESIGLPQIGTRHLGAWSVRGRRRVPWPAARMKAFMDLRLLIRNKLPAPARFRIAVQERIVYKHMRAFKIEPERHLAQALCGKGRTHLLLIFLRAIEKQKTTAAGARDFPSDSAVPPGERVD